MKHRQSILPCQFGCALIFLGLIFPIACNKKQPVISNYNDAYHYPIKPGTEEWKKLRNHEDMIMVCQIPDEILRKMSTPGLVETVLNYPLYMEMTASSNSDFQKAFEWMSSKFNGFQELYKRKDAGSVLLARYKSMDPAAFGKDFTSIQRGDYTWSFVEIEILLAQNTILINMTETQRQELRKEALKKYEIKKNISSYGGYSLRLTLFLADKAFKK